MMLLQSLFDATVKRFVFGNGRGNCKTLIIGVPLLKLGKVETVTRGVFTLRDGHPIEIRDVFFVPEDSEFPPVVIGSNQHYLQMFGSDQVVYDYKPVFGDCQNWIHDTKTGGKPENMVVGVAKSPEEWRAMSRQKVEVYYLLIKSAVTLFGEYSGEIEFVRV